MAQCELCHQETTNIAEKRVGASYNPTTQEQTPIEYTMPLYCDDCLKDLAALDVDQADIESVRREWDAYRNQGLGKSG